MQLTIGFSPCPNDTFIFDALINKKINTGDIEFKLVLEDVQTLNEMAIAQKLDITKISYGVLPLVLENYTLLSSGSALGNGVGPLLIAPRDIAPSHVSQHTVAIPGKNTTAHILFSLAYPQATKKVFLRYDEIEDFVLNSGDNLGVIIHENRFTYRQKGLFKVTDLGDFWEKETGLPIPLGGIVARRNLSHEIISQVQMLIRESLEYSYANDEELSDFVKTNSQEMSEEVMRMHIDLYVNNFSIDLGASGKNAIRKFLEVYSRTNKMQMHTDTTFFT